MVQTLIETRLFPLRPFPRKLMRSMAFFAGAGTLMAWTVYSDGVGGWPLPLAILLGSWVLPAVFAAQIARNGFDPVEQLIEGPDGLEALYRDGTRRAIGWTEVAGLYRVEAFRYRAWVVMGHNGVTIRWFGEVEDLEVLMAQIAERSGKAWETVSRLDAAGGAPHAEG